MIGDKLRKRRKFFGLSRSYLSDLSGVSARTISVIEHGGNLSVDVLEKLLVPLGLRLELVEVNPHD